MPYLQRIVFGQNYERDSINGPISTFGGEKLLIDSDGSLPAQLIFTDATSLIIKTQDDALRALDRIYTKNRQKLEEILIKEKLLVRTAVSVAEDRAPVENLSTHSQAVQVYSLNSNTRRPHEYGDDYFTNRDDSFSVAKRGEGFNGVVKSNGDFVYSGTFDKYEEGNIGRKLIVGGEKLEIIRSRAQPTRGTITFIDGSTLTIATRSDALQALTKIYSGNRQQLEKILIEQKLLVTPLDELKAQAPIKNLYSQIQKLQKHALTLKKIDPERCAAATTLATALTQKADTFFNNALQRNPTKNEFEAFKSEFKDLALSDDVLLGRHRKIRNPIILNILIALTGIGSVCLLAKIAYQACTVRKLQDLSFNKMFFFAHTQLQNHTLTIQHSVKNFSLGVLARKRRNFRPQCKQYNSRINK
ncbi:MAG: hypothetical protein H0U75_12095 [Legionella sp.]|nr:hypothetical protein [Legionella sp.]